MSEIQFKFFEDFCIQLPRNRQIPARVKKHAALLAYLILENRPEYQRDQMAAMFWPDLDQADGRNNLRVALNRIKKSLEQAKVDCIVTTRSSISIDPNAGFTVDVLEFRSRVAITHQHNHASRATCAECYDHLIAALDLYRGDFLRHLCIDDSESFEDWRLQWQVQLRNEVVEVVDDIAAYCQSRSDYTSSEAFTRRQLVIDPLREMAHRRLMQLLYFQNHRNGALSHYQELEHLLRTELGVDPDEETLALYQQIESSSLERPTMPEAAEVILTSVPNNLPSELTRYIGNDSALQQLGDHIQQHRLVTLTGPGGIGKTRLSMQLARQQIKNFPDGVYLVRLAPLKLIREIITGIADAIDLEFESGSDLTDQLYQYLQSKRALLILDNYEHVMDASVVVSGLLAHTDRIAILVTSRQKLMISGEAVYPVRGLACQAEEDIDLAENAVPCAATVLFLDAASRVRLDFVPSAADLQQIARIGNLVQGHPLALVLAAGWLESLSCIEIAEEISGGNDILSTEMSDIPDRQRSVDATCEYSWRLLNDDERRVFASLSVFRGGFDRSAALAVTGAGFRELGGLVNKSLLQHDTTNGSYEIHDLMRQFAGRRLCEMEIEYSVLAAHGGYYLDRIDEWLATIEREPGKHSSESIGRNFDNIRVAWQRAAHNRDFQRLKNSINGLRKFCTLYGREQDLVAFVEPLLSTDDSLTLVVHVPRESELNLLLALGVAYRNTKGYTDPALTDIFRRAHDLCKDLENSPELFSVLYGLWSFNLVRGNLPACEEIVAQWQQRLVNVDSNSESDFLVDARFVIHFIEGPVRYLQGRFVDACELMEAGLACERPERQAAIVAAYGLNFAISGRFWLSQAQCIAGKAGQGIATADELESMAEGSGQPLAKGFAALGMSLISETLKLSEDVERYARRLSVLSVENRISQFFKHHGKMFEGSALSRSEPEAGIAMMQHCMEKGIGSKNYFDSDVLLLANALIRSQHYTRALSLIDNSLQTAKTTGICTCAAETMRVRGEICRLQSDIPAAEQSLNDAIEMAGDQGARLFELRATVSLCRLEAEQGKPARAQQRLQRMLQQPLSADFQLRDVIEARELLIELDAS